MSFSGRETQKRVWQIAAFFGVCWMIASCLHTSQPSEPVVTPAPCPPCPPDRSAELESHNTALEAALASSKETQSDLEQDISNLKLQVLGFEALINDLRRRSDAQQKRLDAAIIEVVRAKSKLRSLESKAEAASALAEAEIAVKALRKRGVSDDDVTREEISKADQLLSMSINEFKALNFGGALYLANQAKEQVRAVQARVDKKTEALEGESLFAQPLELKVIKDDCNLREGPGLSYQVVGKLSKDEVVVGFSFKESWVRVETKAGQSGWVFQSLIGAP